jgi:hypothetical protein
MEVQSIIFLLRIMDVQGIYRLQYGRAGCIHFQKNLAIPFEVNIEAI